MRNLAQKEWVKSLFLAVLIIGIAAAAYAVYSFLTTQYQIGQNLAYQVQNELIPFNMENPSESEGLMLMRADLELHRLQADLSRSIIIGGAGLILIAVGWIGREVIRPRTAANTKVAT